MGLIKTAAKVAVASSVHGRVQRRQQLRWAEQDAQPAAQANTSQPQAPTSAGGAPPGADAMAAQLALLTQLGDLRAAGVLSDAEFEAKKSAILNT